MSGLLDKASAAKKAESSDAEEKKPKEIEGKAIEMKADGKIRSISSGPASENAMKISLAGWVIILVGAILSLQGGSWGVIVVSIVLVVGIGAIVYADRMRGSLSTPKLAASVIVAVLIATTPYAAVTLVPTNASMAIGDIELNEDSNELSFKVRGTMSSVDVSIEADGVEVWTGSGDVNNDMKKFKVSLSDIFSGNSEDHAGNVVVDYVIKGESSTGNSDEREIPSRFTTREAQNAGVRIAELHDSNDADHYVGITIEVLVGLLGPSESAENGGGFSAVGLRPMKADYTVNVRVSGGDSWSENAISVDGDMATWTSKPGQVASASTAGWFGLTGSGTDNSGVFYLDKSEFYDTEGCYTFTVDIVNNLGAQETFTSEFSWNIDLSSGDQQSNDPVQKGEGVGQTC